MMDVYLLAGALGGSVLDGVDLRRSGRDRLGLFGARLWDGSLPGDGMPEEGCIYVADALQAASVPARFRDVPFAFAGAALPGAVGASGSGGAGMGSGAAGMATGPGDAVVQPDAPGACSGGVAPDAPGAELAESPVDGWGQLGFASDCLLLPDTGSAASALAGIQRSMERFSSLEREAVRAASVGRPVSEVLDICSGAVANPLALFDSTFSLISTSGFIGLGRSDSIWDDVVESGFVGTSSLAEWDSDMLLSSCEPVYNVLEGIGTLQTCIRVDGRIVGFLCSTDISAPIDDGEISGLLWVQRIFEMLWTVMARGSERVEMSDQVFVRVIDGLPVEDDLVDRALGQRRWERDGSYRLMSVFRHGGQSIGLFDSGPLKRELSSLFPDAAILRYGDELLLALYGGRGEAAIGGRPFRRLLTSLELGCAVSEPVRGFWRIKRAHEQCMAVRSATQTEADPLVVAWFEDSLEDCLMAALEGSGAADALCMPQVESLPRRRNGTEMLHSLRVYLACGCSLGPASEALDVHRNTLRYRIEQAERWIGRELEDMDESEMLRLYLSCIVVERRISDGESIDMVGMASGECA